MCQCCGCQCACCHRPRSRIAKAVRGSGDAAAFEYVVVGGVVYGREASRRWPWNRLDWKRANPENTLVPLEVYNGLRCDTLEKARMAVELFEGAGDFFPTEG